MSQLIGAQGGTPLSVLAALEHALADAPQREGVVTSTWLQSTTGLSRRAVQYALRVLHEQGKVQVTTGRGRGHPSRYRLLEAPQS